MVILTDLGALGAAAIVVALFLMVLPLSRRVFKPGPMFSPEGFARLLVAEIAMRKKHGAPNIDGEVAAARAAYLSRFPASESVFDDAVRSLLR